MSTGGAPLPASSPPPQHKKPPFFLGVGGGGAATFTGAAGGGGFCRERSPTTLPSSFSYFPFPLFFPVLIFFQKVSHKNHTNYHN